MNNPWLKNAANKKMFEEIDHIAMDIWGSDGTLSDFFAALTDDQTDLIFAMKIKDFSSDMTDLSCIFEFQQP